AARSLKRVVVRAIVTREARGSVVQEVHRVDDLEAAELAVAPPLSDGSDDVAVDRHAEAGIRIDLDLFLDLLAVAPDDRAPRSDDLYRSLRRRGRRRIGDDGLPSGRLRFHRNFRLFSAAGGLLRRSERLLPGSRRGLRSLPGILDNEVRDDADDRRGRETANDDEGL